MVLTLQAEPIRSFWITSSMQIQTLGRTWAFMFGTSINILAQDMKSVEIVLITKVVTVILIHSGTETTAAQSPKPATFSVTTP